MADAKSNVNEVLQILESEYPDARVLLEYETPLQLLVATIMAAQCTDERVNMVTRGLFKKYRTALDFANADQDSLEAEIKPTGFYRNKAKSIIACCRELVARYGGEVPQTLEELVSLPGVGRKTANIVLGNAFGKQAIAVDTHVGRVAQRLGLSSSSDPEKIERDLMELIPQDRWTRATHLLGFLGRYRCVARKPLCEGCPLFIYCPTGPQLTCGS